MTVLQNVKPNHGKNVITNVNPGRLILPKYKTFVGPYGVENVKPDLEINSSVVYPSARYKLGDANATNLVAYGYGATLVRQAVATPPTYNTGSPGLSVLDDSCKFNASDYYMCGDTTTGNVSTNDFVAKLRFEATGTTSVIAAKRNAGVGWEIGIDASDRLYLTIEDSSGSVTVVSAALIANTINWAEINADRSGSAQIYINGATSGAAVDISGRALTLDSATALAIGADSAGNTPYDKRVMYFSLWQKAAWLDSHLQATLAAKTNAQVWGNWPHTAAGTKQATFTRAFAAYLDKVESGYRKYYYVGSEAFRLCHRQDSNGVNVRGYLPETQATNLFPYSEDFSTFDLIEAGTVVVDNAVVCPDGRTVAASIAGDSDDEQHGISDDITLTADTYSYSYCVKPGDKDWFYLNNSTVANCSCYFDITNGVKGTEGANCKGYIEGPFYSGDSTPFYRCCIVFTGTVAAHTLQASPAHADNDVDFVGDGSTPNIYVWGAQVELGDYMTSPVITSGATATRLKDQNQGVASANIGGEDRRQGSMFADMLLSNFSVANARRICTLSDGGSGADTIALATDSSEDCVVITSASGGDVGYNTVSASIGDNKRHTLGISYAEDKVFAYLDGTLGVGDTSADMPDDIDIIHVGMRYDNIQQLNGLIQNFRIYDEPLDHDPEGV